MPGVIGGLAVVAVAAILATWRLRPVRGQHRGLADDPMSADRPAGPPWPPAGPPAADYDRLWHMAAAYRPDSSERLRAPRIAAGRLTRTEVIRTYFDLADRPVARMLAAAGWPTGYPFAYADEITHL